MIASYQVRVNSYIVEVVVRKGEGRGCQFNILSEIRLARGGK